MVEYKVDRMFRALEEKKHNGDISEDLESLGSLATMIMNSPRIIYTAAKAFYMARQERLAKK